MMKISSMLRTGLLSATLASVPLLGACGDDDDPIAPVTPSRVTIVSGGAQTASAGATLTDSLVLRVTTSAGQPVSGVNVAWNVNSGGGTLSSPSSTTDASGRSAVAYTAGNTPGTAVVAATVSGLTPVEFSTTVVSGAASVIVLQSADSMAVTAGGAAMPLSIIVRDAFGNPVSGATVTWAMPDGNGATLGAATSVSNESGVATVQFTPGTTAGNRTVTASTGTGVSLGMTVVVNSAGSIR